MARQDESSDVGTTPRMTGVSLGRLFGVEIHLDVTLVVVFVLVAMSLGTGTLPAWHPGWAASLRWSVALAAAVLFFVSVLLHEIAHAVVAQAQGLRVRGITLFMLGGVARIDEEPKTPGREFLMAIAGPLMSLAIGITALLVGRTYLLAYPDPLAEPALALREVGPLGTLLLWLGPVNLVLGLFNLVPGFPLDGGRVLRSMLWAFSGDVVLATRWAAGAGEAFGWVLIGGGVLMMFGWSMPVLGGGLVQGIWLALLGWYLTAAARASLLSLTTKAVLSGVPVREVMLTDFSFVDPDLSVDTFVETRVFGSRQRCFPVASGQRFLGLVSLHDVRALHEQRGGLAVKDIMTPAANVVAIGPDEPADAALDTLTRFGVNQLAVVDASGALVGLVRRRDLLDWLALRAGPEGGLSRPSPLPAKHRRPRREPPPDWTIKPSY